MTKRANRTGDFLANANDLADRPNGGHGEGETLEDGGETGCTVRQLPDRLVFQAAEVAASINPVNAPVFGRTAGVPHGVWEPQAAAVVTSKYWGPRPRRLTVSFMESTPADLRTRIVGHLNAWAKTGCIQFVQTQGVGQIRISLGRGGYWSYLGTDVLLIPRNRPTMNLQGFTMATPESEYRRVVRHEAGHTLGMPHEHMRKQLVARIDPGKAYEYFLRTSGWDRGTVDQQVLTPLDEATIMATPADQDSIMCYRLPGSVTRDGQPIRGGSDINRSDYAFVGKIYPKPSRNLGASASAADEPESDVNDWSTEDDVDVSEALAALEA